MKRYAVCYLDGKREISTRAIDASSHEDAYKQYLKIKGISNYPIRTFSFHDRTKSIWEDHKIAPSIDRKPTSREAEAQLTKANTEKTQLNIKESEAATKVSTSSTDSLLLKELIQQQKESNKLLKKIRWSLLVIHFILVLWYVFGWVIKPL